VTRVLLLTTETTHHVWFAQQVAAATELVGIVSETRAAAPPYAVAHAFEDERDAYEREVLLGGKAATLADVAAYHSTETANDGGAVEWMRSARPDLIAVFGTGKLGPELIDAAPAPLLNLHGGDPEDYRGLDTHLWAIWHADFDGLVTTLHFVDRELDTGAVVSQARLPIERGAELHTLRAVNTQVCVDLTLAAAKSLAESASVPARPQVRRGRYYSWMPAVLKDRCVERFAAWTSGL
jgi:folate-dependent phosphoribosylglycinamide formyltransferase PurN